MASRIVTGLVTVWLTWLVSASAGGVNELPRSSSTLADFVQKERAIALQGALNNIGSGGSLVQGAGSGFVVASPSKVNPNCAMTIPRHLRHR